MYSSYDSKKLACDTLSKSNWRQFFTDFRLLLESKGQFYGCQYNKQEYCSTQKLQSRVPTNIEVLTAHIAALRVHEDNKSNQAEEISRTSNYERSLQWDKDAAAVIFLIRQNSSNDFDTIEDYASPKEIWDALNSKYSKIKPGDLRQLEREITSFDRTK
ncbi:hypothetical protein OnM2_031042 [Erysiphe neolycopersici]|uniref:Uncharacterized protein n=1 Tax=Erysiphe neolycopersici TaxID=212602 RepID=A0A420HZ73_9PEZI|nr:hypothetical protein OnM2_031042 [Erysiphe neolycopersici]